MKKSISYNEIIRISIPIIASSAIENITSIINTAFLGHVSATALGASAIGGIFYLSLIMLGFGFGIGVQIVVARRFGENKISEIGPTIQQSLFFLISLSFIFIIIFHLWGLGFFKKIIQSEEIYSQVKVYLSYRIWGLFFAYLNIIFRGFYTGIIRTKVIGYYSIILAVTNIFFDYVLIFGNLGFPKMEIAGAGLASVISEITATLFFLVYTLKQKNIYQFGLHKLYKFDTSLMLRILKIASPVMLQFTLSFGGWFLFFMFVEKMGEIPLAISNLTRTFYLIALLPLWGFASTTNTLVSYLLGNQRQHELKKTVLKILILSFSTISTIVILLLIFSKYYFNIFTNDAQLVVGTLPLIYIVATTSILVSISIILYNIISGAGKTIVTLIIEAIVMFVYILWAYLVAYQWHGSVIMIWMSEVWYGILMGILAGCYLKFANWKSSKV